MRDEYDKCSQPSTVDCEKQSSIAVNLEQKDSPTLNVPNIFELNNIDKANGNARLWNGIVRIAGFNGVEIPTPEGNSSTENLSSLKPKKRLRPFHGIKKDFRARGWEHYISDFEDVCNLKVLASILFMFFTSIGPAITFASVFQLATKDAIGPVEVLFSTAINGIFYAIFAGQPLTILGVTGINNNALSFTIRVILSSRTYFDTNN